jgi:hypothetical protein
MKFNKVETIMLTVSDSVWDYNVYPTVEDELIDFGEFGLSMKSAIALRDWLNTVIPSTNETEGEPRG